MLKRLIRPSILTVFGLALMLGGLALFAGSSGFLPAGAGPSVAIASDDDEDSDDVDDDDDDDSDRRRSHGGGGAAAAAAVAGAARESAERNRARAQEAARIQARGIEQGQTSAAAPPASSGVITPPNTGDGGLTKDASTAAYAGLAAAAAGVVLTGLGLRSARRSR